MAGLALATPEPFLKEGTLIGNGSGWYNLSADVTLEKLEVNATNITFWGLHQYNRTCNDTDTGFILCDNLENCTLPYIFYQRNLTFNAGNTTVTTTTTTTTLPGGGGGGGALPPRFKLMTDDSMLIFTRGNDEIVYFNVTNYGGSDGTFFPQCEGDCDYIRTYGSIDVNVFDTALAYFLVRLPIDVDTKTYNFKINGNQVDNPLDFNLTVKQDTWLLEILKQEGITGYYDLSIVAENDLPICRGDVVDWRAMMISNQMPGQDVVIETMVTDIDNNPMTQSESQTIFVGNNSIVTAYGSIQTIENWEEGYYRLYAKMSEPNGSIVESWTPIFIDSCTDELPLLKELRWLWNFVLMRPIADSLPLLGDFEVPFLALIIVFFIVYCLLIYFIKGEKGKPILWSMLAWSLLLTLISSVIVFASILSI